MDNIFLYLDKHSKSTILLPTTSGEQRVSHLHTFFKLHCIFQETNTSTCVDSFHWILFSFFVDLSKVFIFDSFRVTSDKTKYNVVDMLKQAWTHLCRKHGGKSKRTFIFTMISQYVSCSQISCQFLQYNKKIFHNFVFAYVLTQSSSTKLCEYYVCDLMHIFSSHVPGTNLKEMVNTQNCNHM
jgi:hypothetical protein